MPIAEAHVETDRPGRYLVQLCRHASHMGRNPGGRLRAHLPGTQSGTPRIDAEWSETHGTVSIAGGTCFLQATQDALLLRVEAADEATLRGVQEAITRNLSRFGRRDQLAVEWQRPDATHLTAEPVREPRPARAHQAHRKHRTTIVLAVAIALVVAVHLGLGGTVLAASPWTQWATNIVLAAILLKVLVIAGHLVLGRLVLRRRRRAAVEQKPDESP